MKKYFKSIIPHIVLVLVLVIMGIAFYVIPDNEVNIKGGIAMAIVTTMFVGPAIVVAIDD